MASLGGWLNPVHEDHIEISPNVNIQYIDHKPSGTCKRMTLSMITTTQLNSPCSDG